MCLGYNSFSNIQVLSNYTLVNPFIQKNPSVRLLFMLAVCLICVFASLSHFALWPTTRDVLSRLLLAGHSLTTNSSSLLNRKNAFLEHPERNVLFKKPLHRFWPCRTTHSTGSIALVQKLPGKAMYKSQLMITHYEHEHIKFLEPL